MAEDIWESSDVVEAMAAKTLVRIAEVTRSVTEAHLREIFAHFGTVERVFFVANKIGGRRGVTSDHSAYLLFASDKDAATAIDRMNGGQLDGKKLEVSLQTERPPKPVQKQQKQQQRHNSQSSSERTRG